MLRFQLLGPFRAWRGDQPIAPEAWRTRHTLTVLKILLHERDRLVAFDRLIELVWPDTPPGAARNSLQAAVRTLRRVLEPELRRGADSAS